MVFLRKYNTATGAGTHVRVPVIKRAVVDFAVSADWTPAAGDVKVSKDGGAQANIGTLPTYSNGAWEFQFTGTELSAKQLEVMIVDAATKAIEDQCFLIETYGNASAMYQADLSAANLPANVAQWSGTNVAAVDTAGYPKVTVKSGTGTGEISLAAGIAGASLSAGERNSAADAILTRSITSLAATIKANPKCLGGIVTVLMHTWKVVAGVIKWKDEAGVYDGTNSLSRTIAATDSSANPISDNGDLA